MATASTEAIRAVPGRRATPAQPATPAARPRSIDTVVRRRATRTRIRAASSPPATATMPGPSRATGLGRPPRSLTSCTTPAVASTTTTPSTSPAARPARRGGTRRSSSDTGRRNTCRDDSAAVTSPPTTATRTVSSTGQVKTTSRARREHPVRRAAHRQVARDRAQRRGHQQQQEDLREPEPPGLARGETAQLGQPELGRALLGGRPHHEEQGPPAEQHELGDGQRRRDPHQVPAVVGARQGRRELRVGGQQVGDVGVAAAGAPGAAAPARRRGAPGPAARARPPCTS